MKWQSSGQAFSCLVDIFPNNCSLQCYVFQGAANANRFLREGGPGPKCGCSPGSGGCQQWGLEPQRGGAVNQGPSREPTQVGTGGGKEETRDKPPTGQEQSSPRTQAGHTNASSPDRDWVPWAEPKQSHGHGQGLWVEAQVRLLGAVKDSIPPGCCQYLEIAVFQMNLSVCWSLCRA